MADAADHEGSAPAVAPATVAHQVLEIRVHGVSNTPPHSVLLAGSETEIVRVAGDEVTGFYRRRDADPSAPVQTQAYSWGQLTAGVRARKDVYRALWMLLLPFALVNVAFWSRTRFPPQWQQARTGGLTSYLARLLAASLTCTLVLAAAGIGVDLVGWQWRWADPDRVRRIGWLDFVHADPAHAGRPLAVGLVLPTLVLLVIWLVARRSFAYESEIPSLHGTQTQRGLPALHMSGPDFWRGNQQVKRLASLHLLLGAVSACAVAAGPLLPAPAGDPWPVRALGALLPWLLGAAALAAVVVLALPAVTTRGDRARSAVTAWPTPSAAALVTLTTSYLVASGHPRGPAPTLPGFDVTIRVLFLVQLVLVLGLALSCRWPVGRARLGVAALTLLAGTGGLLASGAVPDLDARETFALVALVLSLAAGLALGVPWRVRDSLGEGENRVPGSAGRVGLDGPAWRGAGSALLAGLGLMLAALYAAGVLVYVADWLGGSAASVGAADGAVVIPASLQWAAVGLVPFTVVVSVVGAIAYSRLGPDGERQVGGVLARYPGAASEHERVRAADVGRARALHTLVADQLLTRVGWLALLFALPLLVTATAAAATGEGAEPLLSGPAETVVVWCRTSGLRLSILLLAGIVLAGALVYRAKPERRGVGIVWDLATFWPRACHPFAPPCYAERCVPQLVTRISGDDTVAAVVLAGHSQGAVLSLATVLQLPPRRRSRLYLITFGTQLHRLYGRVFPAFFGPVALHHVAELLQDHGDDPGRRWLRWRSLYRPTDPLGYPVEVTLAGPADGAALCVDHPGVPPHRPVDDPAGLRPLPAEILDPVIAKHSDYPADPVFLAVRDEAAARLVAARRAEPQLRR